jgi:UDP-N-acetyl-2-amino-2-deoxyglucuronate dehydrogenase
VHFLSVCSPNYLHDAHMRVALRVGADALCEKPLVINPWNLDGLQELEQETGRRIYTVLHLRLHPALVAFRDELRKQPGTRHKVQLSYLTARGRWYDVSWKGVEERSGGIVTNIGIHFFDLLVWLFGDVKESAVHLRELKRAGGTMTLENADVEWYLSADAADLPFEPQPGARTTFRAITVDGKQLEFSEGFTDLHTRVYQEVIDGRGFRIADARPSIELSHRIRHAPITDPAPAEVLRARAMPEA